MLIIDLIKHKLKHDLQHELQHQLQHHLQDNSQDDIELENMIHEKINKIDIEERFRKKLPQLKNDTLNHSKCMARVWSSHYGNQCTRCKIKNYDFCIQHQGMIDKYGYLSLGRIDENKPLVNENGNRIPWYNNEILDMLNIIFEYIFIKLIK